MKTAAAFATGIVLWPALEYGLHLVLAHTVTFKNKFRTEHLKHHAHRDYFVAGADKLLGLRRRKHHFIHHFADPRSNQGVTTTLFDHVFGTLATRDQVAIPKAFVPLWMLEPGSDDRIAEPYRRDFRLASA